MDEHKEIRQKVAALTTVEEVTAYYHTLVAAYTEVRKRRNLLTNQITAANEELAATEQEYAEILADPTGIQQLIKMRIGEIVLG